MLGGSGDLLNLFEEIPLQSPFYGGVFYLMMHLGYTAGDLVSTVFLQEHGKDYPVMLLHHLLTILLSAGSIFSNTYNIGCVVTFVMDFADIFACGASGFGCTIYTKWTSACLGGLFLAWIYTRVAI